MKNIKVCKIKGCKKILGKWERGTCQMHRSRKFRHGTYDISPRWNMLKKGQPCLTKYGYLRIFADGRRILQRRYIMEQHIGRLLERKEIVHHINHIKTDNRIENLELLSNNSEHIKKHHVTSTKGKQGFQHPNDTKFNLLHSQ